MWHHADFGLNFCVNEDFFLCPSVLATFWRVSALLKLNVALCVCRSGTTFTPMLKPYLFKSMKIQLMATWNYGTFSRFVPLTSCYLYI
jgi:hypothetical protein